MIVGLGVAVGSAVGLGVFVINGVAVILSVALGILVIMSNIVAVGDIGVSFVDSIVCSSLDILIITSYAVLLSVFIDSIVGEGVIGFYFDCFICIIYDSKNDTDCQRR